MDCPQCRWSARGIDPKVADVAAQLVTVQHRLHEDPGPPLALEAWGRIETLEIGLGDDGIDAPLPDLVDDGVRIDDPPLHQTRPQEEIVDDRRDPTIG